ncbi:MAG: hypothetical protein OIN87_06875 [Candidatus Methanoperedens sp.]|nr:hypothetical protein [Candidatus Methanoperedens sp.]
MILNNKKGITCIIIVITVLAVIGITGCLEENNELQKMYKSEALANTSLDEHSPVWSPDGSKIFFKLTESIKADGYIRGDTWIYRVNTDGSQIEKLVKIEEHPDSISNIVLSPDMKNVFYVKEIIKTNTVLGIAWKDPKVREEVEALAHEYPVGSIDIDDKKRIGITDNLANVVMTAVMTTNSGDSSKLRTEGQALDIYIDLRNETVTKVDRIEKAKVPEGEKPKMIWQIYMVDIDGKNQIKIAELPLEDEYVDDLSYIGGTQAEMYQMLSWDPERTKIIFSKLEATGYVWVWKKEEKKWMRYKVGTEPSVPVVQSEIGEMKLIAREHERTAWAWDFKDNELKFIGHLSYGIVHRLGKEEVVWSDDGKYVVLSFVELSEAGATEQIFVIDTEKGESKKLTSFVGSNTNPKWSRDRKKITYARMQPEYKWSPYIPDSSKGYDVWMINIDGSNEKQLTDIPNNSEEGWLSPDGSKVIYSSYRKSSINVDETQKIEIWMMNVDGSDRKLLEKVNAGGIESIEWNPDGSKIAFVTWILRSYGFDRDIYVMDLSSTAKERIS